MIGGSFFRRWNYPEAIITNMLEFREDRAQQDGGTGIPGRTGASPQLGLLDYSDFPRSAQI
jgi:hypothetical protein